MNQNFLRILVYVMFFGNFTAFASKGHPTHLMDEKIFIENHFPLYPPSKWVLGDSFLYTAKEINYVLKAEKPILNDTTNFYHKIFKFDNFRTQTDWNGKTTINLIFSCEDQFYRFETKKTLEDFADTTYNPLIPNLIWLGEIHRADSLLRGKECYILSSSWILPPGIKDNIYRKFIPVTLTKIVPGNEFLPVQVYFKDDKGNEASILTSLSGTLTSNTEFTFPKIFSFTDPYLKYKEIDKDIWQLITLGKITRGMTQHEVRLSVGKPTDINRIPTYSGLIEQWSYDSGTMIKFQDGRVTDFRL